jgi:hypothetical protein
VAPAEVARIQDFLQAFEDIADGLARGQRPKVQVLDARNLVVGRDDGINDARQLILVTALAEHASAAPKP